MPTCRICQHTFKSLRFQTEHIDICTRCVNTLNDSPEPAKNAEVRFSEKLARGMLRNAENNLRSEEEWKRRSAEQTLANFDAAVASRLHDWITKLLADPSNSTRDFKIMRAHRRGLLRTEGLFDYADRNWKEVAQRIRRRDGFRCMECGATNTTLDVHHIIYLSHHGTNQQSNLITLCRKCHEAEHDRIFDWPESQDPDSASPIQPLHNGQTLPFESSQTLRTLKPSPEAPTMQPLYKPNRYPVSIRADIKAMPPLATEIANRWMIGWPRTVEALLESNQYLDALKTQEEAERAAYSRPGNRHLARHEIADLYGLSDAPPTP